MASAKAIRFAIHLGRILPPRLGYWIADAAARGLSSRRNMHDVAMLRRNLQVVLGPQTDPARLQQMVHQTFRHIARAYYDLYRAVALGPDQIAAAVEFTPRARAVIDTYFGKGRGIVAVTGHYGNFDLAALAYSLLGFPTQVISWPRSREDYTMQNEIRSLLGLNVTPLSIPALKEAVQTLRTGGIVATGIDRPPPAGSGEELMFFSYPARLPVGHVRLALQANAYLVVAHSYHYPGRPHLYGLDFEEPIEVIPGPDRQQTMRLYAQRVLALVEDHIRQHPDQWYMFHPVWETLPVNDSL